MKCKVEMTRRSKHDPSTNSKTVYLGDMACKENRMGIRYNEHDSGAHCLIIYDNETLHIKRTGDTTSDIKLKENEKTVNVIRTPYGNIEMIFETYKIRRTATALEVGYRLVDENSQVVDDILINWNIKKEGIS